MSLEHVVDTLEGESRWEVNEWHVYLLQTEGAVTLGAVEVGVLIIGLIVVGVGREGVLERA